MFYSAVKVGGEVKEFKVDVLGEIAGEVEGQVEVEVEGEVTVVVEGGVEGVVKLSNSCNFLICFH
ncbi:hypothetical protein WH8501_01715 [Crocosphaera watsonii WH 8501]|uniref:hypothetical protein n=1 Tax=Crocosphaera watsonii TaxID=263511 RepID=UPI003D303D2A